MPNDSSSITLRRAALDDVPEIVPLFEAYRAWYGKPAAAEQARVFLHERLERGESVIFVAELTEGTSRSIVGFAQLYRALSSLSLGRVMILNDLFVVAHARRLGVARQLVEASIAHAKREGALRLELSTQHTNTKARALYDSLGFVADDEFAVMSVGV